MMPGLITPEPVNLYTFKHIKKNDLVALCLNGNDASIAIGKAHYSGDDMYMSGMRGKCLNILQIYQDTLWALGNRTIPVPNIPTAPKVPESQKLTDNKPETETISTDDIKVETESELAASIEKLEIKDDEKLEDKNEEIVDHEKILTDCFLSAIKFKSKEFKLPIIVSTFMKTMQSCW